MPACGCSQRSVCARALSGQRMLALLHMVVASLRQQQGKAGRAVCRHAPIARWTLVHCERAMQASQVCATNRTMQWAADRQWGRSCRYIHVLEDQFVRCYLGRCVRWCQGSGGAISRLFGRPASESHRVRIARLMHRLRDTSASMRIRHPCSLVWSLLYK